MLWAELHRHRAGALAVVEERRGEVEEAETSDPADGWLDRTKAGDLLRRYHGAAERSFYRALAELNRTRRMPDSPVDDGAPIEARTDDGERVCDEAGAPVGPFRSGRGLGPGALTRPSGTLSRGDLGPSPLPRERAG